MKKKLSFYNSSLIRWEKLLLIDWFLLSIVTILCIIGIGSLYSASVGDWYPWALNHAYRCFIGIILVLIFSLIKPEKILKYSYFYYLISIMSLIYVEFFGVGDVKRWIDLKFIYIQPSELTKIALILLLAKYFSDFPIKKSGVIFLIIPFILVLLPTLLIMNQPDLGTGFMLLLLGGTIIFLAGLNWKILVFLITVLLGSIPVLWHYLYDYQKHRIMVFLNPQTDTLGSGYQIMQSKIAIGSGGIFGKGYLLGSQSRLEYLPEKHTDFVFTLVAEEMGLIGSLFVILLFILLIYLLLKNYLNEENLANKITIFGVSFLFFLYVSLNIGMVTGLIPVVGAPLPFISHGGTSLLTVFIGLGVVQSIRVHKDKF